MEEVVVIATGVWLEVEVVVGEGAGVEDEVVTAVVPRLNADCPLTRQTVPSALRRIKALPLGLECSRLFFCASTPCRILT